MRITYYLFRKSVTSFNQVWRDGTVPPADYIRLSLRPTIQYEAEAYLLPNRPTTPDWWTFVEPYCEVPEERRPLNRASSFVLLLKAKDRVFAATFGHGFAALDRAALEADFGLKVTLNSVDPKRLRSVQARNIDPTTVSKQLVVNQDAALSVFDVDLYQNLLSKMEGVPAKTALGRRVAGSDACCLTSETSLPTLALQCAELLKYYGSKQYSKEFPFVDQVRLVRDDHLVADLDGQLAEALAGKGAPTLTFALPDVSEYDRIQSYRASRGRWARTFLELDAQEILSRYNEDHPDARDQAEVRISALDGDAQAVTDFTIRRCVVFEASRKKRLYVLTLSQWYQVDADYAGLVDEHVAQLPVIRTTGFLPTINAGMSEGEYNATASKGPGMAPMDKRLVRPAGPASSIEVCDLFSKHRQFVHVKKHTRSATLSHLLAQGTVSARLFLDDRGYRQSFRKALPSSFRSLVGVDRIEPSKYSVVYAITAAPTVEIPGQLPFFTKVNLLFHCREIQRMGMTAQIHHIHETA